MADYTKSKPTHGGQYVEGETESPWDRLEPLVSPDLVVARHLFGIPLVSATRNPITGKVDVMTPELIKDLIEGAVSELELEIGIQIMPVQVSERLPFDRNEFESFGFFRLPQRPIASIEALRIESSDGTNFFEFPLNWIETGNLAYGQINILPLSPANTNFNFASLSGGGPAGLIYMTMLKNLPWLPSYFTCVYTAGFKDGKLPRVLNEIIGAHTAIHILSLLAATHAKTTSTSLGIDGLSQSVGTPGPALFESRIKDLTEKKQKLVNKFKKQVGLGIIVGNV